MVGNATKWLRGRFSALSVVLTLLLRVGAFDLDELPPMPLPVGCNTGDAPQSTDEKCAFVSSPAELHAALDNQKVKEIWLLTDIHLEEADVVDVNVTVSRDVVIAALTPGILLSANLSIAESAPVTLEAVMLFSGLVIQGLGSILDSSNSRPETTVLLLGVSPWIILSPRPNNIPWLDRIFADIILRTAVGSVYDIKGWDFYGVGFHNCEILIDPGDTLRSMYFSPLDWTWNYSLEYAAGISRGAMGLLLSLGPQLLVGDHFVTLLNAAGIGQFKQAGFAFNTTMHWDHEIPPVPRPELPPQDSCQTTSGLARGRDYTGSVSMTVSGRVCLPWRDVAPVIGGDKFASIEGNACRNPLDHGGVWCFVAADGSDRWDGIPITWEYCDVPQCGALEPQLDCWLEEDGGRSYRGEASETADGEPCMPWGDSVFSLYGQEDGNYCRNPDGAQLANDLIPRPEKPWCFTELGSWSYCEVPGCAVESNGGLSVMGPNLTTDAAPSEGRKNVTIISVSVISAMALPITIAAGYILLRVRRRRSSRTSEDMEVGETTLLRNDKSIKRATSQGSISTTGSNGFSMEELLPPKNQTESSGHVVFQKPTELGYIELMEEIGNGVTSHVWRSRWLGTLVATKIVVLDRMPEFLRPAICSSVEATVLKSITHPNVVQAFHVYSVKDPPHDLLAIPGDAKIGDGMCKQLWIVQELCDLGDMTRLRRVDCVAEAVRNMNEDETSMLVILVTSLKDVAAGLSYLHMLGIVHGDLKTSNVLLKSSSEFTRGFTCKVTDFGMAHRMSGQDYYFSNNLSGDVQYMAPEALCEHRVSPAMDIYSLGIIIYEAVTGNTWSLHSLSSTSNQFIQQVMGGARPRFPDSSFAGHFKDLAERCWQEDASARPSAVEVSSALDAILCNVIGKEAAQEDFTVTEGPENGLSYQPEMINDLESRYDVPDM